jgi:hypothetical protein
MAILLGNESNNSNPQPGSIPFPSGQSYPPFPFLFFLGGAVSSDGFGQSSSVQVDLSMTDELWLWPPLQWE